MENIILLTDKVVKKTFNREPNKKNGVIKVSFDEPAVGNQKFTTYLEIGLYQGEKLDSFDAQIFNYLLSAQQAGVKSVTVREIFVGIGGSEHFTQDQREKILHSVRKLMNSTAIVEVSKELVEKNHYKADKNFKPCKKYEKDYLRVESHLLPCEITKEKVKGKEVDAVEFLTDSPLFSVAKMKKQLSAVDSKLIKVPKLKVVESAVKLTYELLTRINNVKRSWKENLKSCWCGKGKRRKVDIANKLNKTILLEKLFDACDLPTEKKHHDRFRTMIERILNHFQDCKFIKQWQFRKQGGSFYAIDFDFDAEI